MSPTLEILPMRKVLLVCASVLAMSSGIALAADQPQSMDPRVACKADVEKLCPGVKPGGGAIISCLKQHESQVSPACKDAVASRKAGKKPAAPGPA
jgi:Cysteine rich repeat